MLYIKYFPFIHPRLSINPTLRHLKNFAISNFPRAHVLYALSTNYTIEFYPTSVVSRLSLLSTRKFTHNDMPDKSQRLCVTSPNNIDLSAITSMLIPHSNLRSSCEACTGFHSRAEVDGPQQSLLCANCAELQYCRITHCTAAKECTKSRVSNAQQNIWQMTGFQHTLTYYRTSTLSTIPSATTWRTPLEPYWTLHATTREKLRAAIGSFYRRCAPWESASKLHPSRW